VRELLLAFLRQQMPDVRDLVVHDLERASTGYSRENWLFEASWTEPDGTAVRKRLILRRDPVGSVLETDRRSEFAVLKALEDGPVPLPRTHWLDADGTFLERPSVVMDRADGLCDLYVLEGGISQLPLDRRVRLARRGIGHLAALHRFDWRAAGLGDVLADPGTAGAAAAIAEWRAYLERQQLEPQPELVEVLCWLEAHAPTAQATVLVHGDWKPGNWLIDGDDIVVVLDWETAHLGDPLEDVGWVTNPLRHREHIIPGAWERADLFAAYEEGSGFTDDEAAERIWNVFATFKLMAIMLTGVRSFVEGRADRVWGASKSLPRLLFTMTEPAREAAS
jgi:aminoglycoside phosphotransferase (APT) family kinase protein